MWHECVNGLELHSSLRCPCSTCVRAAAVRQAALVDYFQSQQIDPERRLFDWEGGKWLLSPNAADLQYVGKVNACFYQKSDDNRRLSELGGAKAVLSFAAALALSPVAVGK